MKKLSILLVVLLVLLVFSGITQAASDNQNPNPGQNTAAATFNLSFPVIATDIIEVFYHKTPIYAEDGSTIIDWVLTLDDSGDPIPIEVTESITSIYNGLYPGNDEFFYTEYIVDQSTGCAVDLDLDGEADMTDPIEMSDWLSNNTPWYDQPLTTTSEDPNLIWNADYVLPDNTWQADWVKTEAVVNIDFIDWGNPLENINPIVGQRFPVEVALYEKLYEPMTAYKMGCLEYPSSRIEVFGTSTLRIGDHTKEVSFATVLTNKFFAEVDNPDGTRSNINLSPGIGPSGKMNFASGGGGWIPTMPGVHRIWLHTNDPLISFEGAIVNNDEHYILSTGCMAEELNHNKLEMSGIVGDSTYIDVLVVRPSGGKKTK